MNTHKAKTHHSRLLEGAVPGAPSVVARASEPIVRVAAVEAEEKPKRRMGFLRGYGSVPHDRAVFKAIGAEEIALMYEGD